MLLKLTQAIRLNDFNASAVQLPVANHNLGPPECTVVGWGAEEHTLTTASSYVLKEMNPFAVEYPRYYTRYQGSGRRTWELFLLGDPGRFENRDIGSPLVCRCSQSEKWQVAFLVYDPAVRSGKQPEFSLVKTHLDWITRVRAFE